MAKTQIPTNPVSAMLATIRAQTELAVQAREAPLEGEPLGGEAAPQGEGAKAKRMSAAAVRTADRRRMGLDAPNQPSNRSGRK